MQRKSKEKEESYIFCSGISKMVSREAKPLVQIYSLTN